MKWDWDELKIYSNYKLTIISGHLREVTREGVSFAIENLPDNKSIAMNCVLEGRSIKKIYAVTIPLILLCFKFQSAIFSVKLSGKYGGQSKVSYLTKRSMQNENNLNHVNCPSL